MTTRRYFDAFRKRLVYIGRKADPAMWDDRWDEQDLSRIFAPKDISWTDQIFLNVTKRYLHDGARLLEGGCGLGTNVQLLANAGYEVTGVDFAKRTIERVKSIRPELDLRYGFLDRLAFPDASFDGYWSFGVIEHTYDGYNALAREMLRVIRPGGFLFVTVPALSRLRLFKARLGFFPIFREEKTDIRGFYQFALAHESVTRELCAIGFDRIARFAFNAYKGVSDEIPGTKPIMSALCRISERFTDKILSQTCNHMHLLVYRKNGLSA